MPPQLEAVHSSGGGSGITCHGECFTTSKTVPSQEVV